MTFYNHGLKHVEPKGDPNLQFWLLSESRRRVCGTIVKCRGVTSESHGDGRIKLTYHFLCPKDNQRWVLTRLTTAEDQGGEQE